MGVPAPAPIAQRFFFKEDIENDCKIAPLPAPGVREVPRVGSLQQAPCWRGGKACARPALQQRRARPRRALHRREMWEKHQQHCGPGCQSFAPPAVGDRRHQQAEERGTRVCRAAPDSRRATQQRWGRAAPFPVRTSWGASCAPPVPASSEERSSVLSLSNCWGSPASDPWARRAGAAGWAGTRSSLSSEEWAPSPHRGSAQAGGLTPCSPICMRRTGLPCSQRDVRRRLQALPHSPFLGAAAALVCAPVGVVPQI